MKNLIVKTLIISIFFISAIQTYLYAAPIPVRLKDISRIVEARDNQLMGYGIVVGLKNTGDSRGTAITEIALRNLLSKLGMTPGSQSINARNVASVIVTATLPPFIKKGQRLTVTVSSLGDSSSLVGGTLLLTPLKGPNMRTYAIAQGPVVVSGFSESNSQVSYSKNQSTVGQILQGGIVEEEVSVTFKDQHNITIVLNSTNFVTIDRATKAIQEAGFPNANAIDANTIKVPLADLESTTLVSALATLENIMIVPDASAKIVINSKTGTVVIGEMVRLFPVAITHGSITVRIVEPGDGGAEAGINLETSVQVDESSQPIVFLNPSSTLTSLVNSLNQLGASSKDLISILQSLKQSGALIADIEII